MAKPVSGQEPEDVALAPEEKLIRSALRGLVEMACQCGDEDGVHFHRSDALPILTRLVRAGQRRELEWLEGIFRTRREFDASYGQHNSNPRDAWHSGCATGYEEAADTVHARLALLREE